MTPNELYERLSKRLEEVESGNVMLTLSPGPFSLRVGKCDVYAAKLLLWLQGEMLDDVTFGEFEDVLIAAIWWLHFWAAQIEEANDEAVDVG